MFDKIQMQTLESTQQSVVVLNELGYAFERYVKAIEYSTQIQSIANILSLRLGYFLSYVNAWLIWTVVDYLSQMQCHMPKFTRFEIVSKNNR